MPILVLVLVLVPRRDVTGGRRRPIPTLGVPGDVAEEAHQSAHPAHRDSHGGVHGWAWVHNEASIMHEKREESREKNYKRVVSTIDPFEHEAQKYVRLMQHNKAG